MMSISAARSPPIPERRDQVGDELGRRHLRERPYVEVAAEFGVPVGTLRSQVACGLKAVGGS